MALSPTICSSCNTPNRAGSAFCNHCGSSLTGGGSPSGPTGRIASGQVLKQRYRIIQIVGQGGMGAVYKARDRESDRLVALKIIRPNLALSSEILRRFKQELILARQVTHRNVIRIFDLGEADGIKFITMEFIDGETLRTILLREGKLTPLEASNNIQPPFV